MLFTYRPYSVQPPELLARYPRTDHQVQWSADQIHWTTDRKINNQRQWPAIIDLAPGLPAKKPCILAQAVGLYIKICTILLHCPFKFKPRSSRLGMNLRWGPIGQRDRERGDYTLQPLCDGQSPGGHLNPVPNLTLILLPNKSGPLMIWFDSNCKVIPTCTCCWLWAPAQQKRYYWAQKRRV